MKTVFLIVYFFVLFLGARAQQAFENTLSLNEKEGSPAATLESLDFLAGHWRGEAFGGITEEVWTPALGGSMMCTFKLVVEGAIDFYEICTISEEEETLVLRIKHFNSDLRGWEEKDEVAEFQLVKVESGKVFFDGFTFEKLSDDELNIYVLIGKGDDVKETKFHYRRFR